MKAQWMLILTLIFAIIIAVFAIVNVEQVPVNFIFGEAHWPLVLVILGSAFAGAIISGSYGLFKMYVGKREIHKLRKEIDKLELEIAKLHIESIEEVPAIDFEQQ